MSGHSKFANIKHKKEKNDAAIIIPALLPSAMETICWFSLLVK